MEWVRVWKVQFTGVDGDEDLTALRHEHEEPDSRWRVGDDQDAVWVCSQIQRAY